MADAGDGQPRSETRRRTREIEVRVSEKERARIERRATEHGHETAASFMRTVALNPAEPSPRVRQVVGLIGQVGGCLAEADPILARSNAASVTRLRKHAQMIAYFLREIMEKADDCEGHQDEG